ncbi:hypothetical protein TorRG33x02_262260, partial [Trema orientale]
TRSPKENNKRLVLFVRLVINDCEGSKDVQCGGQDSRGPTVSPDTPTLQSSKWDERMTYPLEDGSFGSKKE